MCVHMRAYLCRWDAAAAAAAHTALSALLLRYGQVAARCGHTQDAIDALHGAACSMPCNWSAWLDLAAVIHSTEQVCAAQPYASSVPLTQRHTLHQYAQSLTHSLII